MTNQVIVCWTIPCKWVLRKRECVRTEIWYERILGFQQTRKVLYFCFLMGIFLWAWIEEQIQVNKNVRRILSTSIYQISYAHCYSSVKSNCKPWKLQENTTLFCFLSSCEGLLIGKDMVGLISKRFWDGFKVKVRVTESREGQTFYKYLMSQSQHSKLVANSLRRKQAGLRDPNLQALLFYFFNLLVFREQTLLFLLFLRCTSWDALILWTHL